ncbi:MAG: enoyl-CoA hydratase-related protein [Vulcanimicrobiaceae bacterium]
MDSASLSVRREGTIATVALSRPELRNAFDPELIAALGRAFLELGADPAVRAIVLRGEGPVFSAGADIGWMRRSIELDEAANREDARALSRMLRAIDRTPKIVIGRIHGAALGGGAGLVAVCDVALAEAQTRFGFTETKLGIVPAVISPFVLAKIGRSQARALALTGERFGAERALQIGLVHEVVQGEEALDAAVARVLTEAHGAAPSAVALAKRLLAEVAELPYDASLEPTAAAIARQRTSAEGQAGLRAFLERSAPPWTR